MHPGARAVALVPADMLGERVQRAADESDGAIRMPAGAAALYLAHPSNRAFACRGVAAVAELREVPRNRRKPMLAGAALACTLRGKVRGDARRLAETA
jgi:hypothetical protein